MFECGGTGEEIVLKDLSKFSLRNNLLVTGIMANSAESLPPLMAYLTSDGNNTLEGIPPEELRTATLSREHMDKKTYATVSKLLSRHVSPIVASAPAPYQLGRVKCILDKEGRALMVDEMELGKTA